MRLHLKSRQPAATTGAPSSCYAMDTRKLGNGRIWLPMLMMFLPSIPFETINLLNANLFAETTVVTPKQVPLVR
jgi:hypothetical protein